MKKNESIFEGKKKSNKTNCEKMQNVVQMKAEAK